MPETFIAPLKTLPWWKRPWGIIVILVVGFILLFGAWFGWLVYVNVGLIKSGQLRKLNDFSQTLTISKASSGNKVDPKANAHLVREDSVYFGDPNSKIEIVEFADFECPFCKQEFPAIRSFMESHRNIKFVYRDFPLIDIHPQAFRAALAGRCAAEQNKFWPMHDQMFLNQQDLSEAGLNKYAKIVGLDMAVFTPCLKTEKYKAQVQRDMQDGAALGVRGTPTFFINGIKIEGVIPVEAWEEIYLRLLENS